MSERFIYLFIYLFIIFLFCHTTVNNTKIMNKEKRDEGMMITEARRPKRN